MSRMTMSRFFELLGAPLANILWSWGAQKGDGYVFLRQWDTDVFIKDGREFVIIAHNDRPAGPREHGWRERQRHIDAIRSGKDCRIVMLKAQDPSARTKRIRTFDPLHIIVGGELVMKDGMTCVSVAERRPVSDFIKPSN